MLRRHTCRPALALVIAALLFLPGTVLAGQAEDRMAELVRQAEASHQAGAYDQGLLAADQALELAAKASLPASHPLVLRARRHQGMNLLLADRYAESAEALAPLLQTAEALEELGADAYITTIFTLSRIFLRAGDMTRALDYGDKTLEATRALLGPDHPAMCLYLASSHQIASAANDLPLALNYLDAALSIMERLRVRKCAKLTLHDLLIFVAKALYMVGNYQASDHFFRQAVQALGEERPDAEKALLEFMPNHILMHKNCALVYSYLGDKEKAAYFLQKGRELEQLLTK